MSKQFLLFKQNKPTYIKNAKGLEKHIGFCSNENLGIKNKSGGHYVYIQSVNAKTGKCTVNVVTSLEKHGKFTENKIRKTKWGRIYPIPKNEANFNLWSGITKNSLSGIDLSSIHNIGKKNIKSKHHDMFTRFKKK